MHFLACDCWYENSFSLLNGLIWTGAINQGAKLFCWMQIMLSSPKQASSKPQGLLAARRPTMKTRWRTGGTQRSRASRSQWIKVLRLQPCSSLGWFGSTARIASSTMPTHRSTPWWPGSETRLPFGQELALWAYEPSCQRHGMFTDFLFFDPVICLLGGL